jgi:hypothetical protein
MECLPPVSEAGGLVAQFLEDDDAIEETFAARVSCMLAAALSHIFQ